MIQMDEINTESLGFNEKLYKNKEDVFEEFFIASRFGDLETIKTLELSPIDLFHKNNEGNTALHMASANGHMEVVQFLLSQYSKINNGSDYLSIKNQSGNTPLHWAAMNGHDKIVCELVKAGANLYAQNNAQKTPLWEAEFHGHTKVVTWLLEHTDLVPKDDNDTEEEY
ncbi:hypothetical protein T552_00932 [Pneumocystis carinii B80]|uniref:Uncharacterized protein n=1 Tax=Pneumocystis carinii (strain B80) TaxID=1408658 RepID=A0A0W4ZMY1_PNEC8|nr:hypothetical protein T552_00932 [Pneumocystis carinii B80]KTW29725.1 hypothetical protein T552_00932 [Pneumocystis carinii B80]